MILLRVLINSLIIYNLGSSSSFNVFNNNNVFNFINPGAGSGYGIQFVSTCVENTVVGNSALNNDFSFDDASASTFGDATLNNFS